MNYIKPTINIKKVKINLFLSNRYIDSVSFPISQVFATGGYSQGTYITAPACGEYGQSDYSGGGAWNCY